MITNETNEKNGDENLIKGFCKKKIHRLTLEEVSEKWTEWI